MADSLKSKTIRALSWRFLEAVGLDGVRFVLGIVLARLLFPRADESDHSQSREKSSMKGLDTNVLVCYVAHRGEQSTDHSRQTTVYGLRVIDRNGNLAI